MDPVPESSRSKAATIRIGADDLVGPRTEPVLAFFGDYTVLGEIAAGGMGVVYHARQRRLNRTVALKMIRAGSLAKEDEIRRFRIEAEAAANLDHPNIVPIYELGEHAGRHYFSMKLVDGESLHDFNHRCQDRAMDWLKQSARLMVKIVRAVHHAHERGILHRDLKPKNILIDENGEPHITDFGLAKVLGQTTQETMADAIMGTPHYMAPEQAWGKTRDVTTAADLYSLGAVLFELLTGHPPFVGGTMLEIIQQVREAPPLNPTELNPFVPRDLATICLKCLEKEPIHRYASAAALADELQRWLNGEPILARPSTLWERGEKWIRRNPKLAGAIGTAALAALVAVVGITWQWRRAERNFSQARHLNARLEVQRAEEFLGNGQQSAGLASLARVLRDHPGNRVAAARLINRLHHRHSLVPFGDGVGAGTVLASWLPNGSVAVAGTNAQGWAVTVRPAAENRGGHSLAHGSERILAMRPTLSGQLLMTGTESGARIWDLTSGRLLRAFTWSVPVPFVAWYAGGDTSRWLAVSNEVVLSGTEGDQKPVRMETRATAIIVSATVSPDGRWLAVVAEDNSLLLHDLQGKLPDRLRASAHADVIRHVSFSTKDAQLVTSSADRSARLWRMNSLEELASLPHAESVIFSEFSPSGKIVVSAARDGQVQLWDTLTGEPTAPALRHPKSVSSARFSPNGGQLITACDDGVVRLWSVQGGQLLAATSPSARPVSHLEFHKDGIRILSNADGGSARTWVVMGGRGSIPSELEPGSSPAGLPDESKKLPAAELARYANAHSDSLIFSDISSNGLWAVTTSRDRTARLWDRVSGKQLCEALVHDAPVNCGRFSADGTVLVTSTSSRKIRLWDSATGEPISDWLASTRPVARVWLSRDGHFVVTADGEVWSVFSGGGQIPNWLPDLGEAVAGLKLNTGRVLEMVPAVQRRQTFQLVNRQPAADWLSRWASSYLNEFPKDE